MLKELLVGKYQPWLFVVFWKNSHPPKKKTDNFKILIINTEPEGGYIYAPSSLRGANQNKRMVTFTDPTPTSLMRNSMSGAQPCVSLKADPVVLRPVLLETTALHVYLFKKDSFLQRGQYAGRMGTPAGCP